MLWVEFVREVRWCWEESQPLPRMLTNGVIDLSTCLIHQKLQMVIFTSPIIGFYSNLVSVHFFDKAILRLLLTELQHPFHLAILNGHGSLSL